MSAVRYRKLSEIERRILAAADQSAEASISTIAKISKTKTHTVQYTLNRLKEAGIIFLLPLINVMAYGYSVFSVYFSISEYDRKKRAAFLATIKKDQRVVWLAEIGGEYQYTLSLCVPDIYTMADFFDSVAKETMSAFFAKAVAGQYSVTHTGRGYLSGEKKRRIGLESTHIPKLKSFALDDLDKTILGGMSGKKFISRRELAQRLKLPFSTVDLRIRKLEEAEVIKGYAYEISTSKLGIQRFILLIFAKGIGAVLYDRLKKFSLENPFITHLCACLGAWDFELHVEVTNPSEVSDLQQELYDLFESSINTIKVFSKYSDLKFSMTPFAN
jgi:DNA-binding Lrp family transcriptional regulator